MRRDGQQELLGLDAAAVIGDANQLAAAAGDLDVDSRCAGVERVLQQLFDDAGRTLDHLARGDLVDNARRESLDIGHAWFVREGRVRILSVASNHDVYS